MRSRQRWSRTSCKIDSFGLNPMAESWIWIKIFSYPIAHVRFLQKVKLYPNISWPSRIIRDCRLSWSRSRRMTFAGEVLLADSRFQSENPIRAEKDPDSRYDILTHDDVAIESSISWCESKLFTSISTKISILYEDRSTRISNVNLNI